MKNILITGANGQLGSILNEVLSGVEGVNILLTDIDRVDITDYNALNTFMSSYRVDLVVNCAAYTAVDAAEDEPELCHKVNTLAVGNIARAAVNCGARVIHISTDYIFDGDATLPYKECDTPNPQSVYGDTKLKGELALQAIATDSIIIRTAWLYSPFGRNFVKTMITLGEARGTLSVVADQVGTPTFAYDLAEAIKVIILSEQWVAGVYHYSNQGVCSWYEFAEAIHQQYGIVGCKINPVTTAEYPTKAKRPFYSVLDKSKITHTYGVATPQWRDSLTRCIELIKGC